MGALCSCMDTPSHNSQKSIEILNVLSSETNPDYQSEEVSQAQFQKALQVLSRRYLTAKLLAIIKDPSLFKLPYSFTPGPLTKYESDSIQASEAEYGLYYPQFSFGEYTVSLPLVSIDQILYQGEWDMVTKTPHGTGTSYCLVSHEKYVGQFSYGKKHGVGRLIKENGDIFEGSFDQDVMHGSGTYIDYLGKVYIGEFRNGEKNGYGKEQDRHESCYEGDFVDGVKHGNGKMIWADGRKYEGEFKEGRITGIGEFLWPDGKSYYGELLNEKLHGKGHVIFQDGSEYEGDFTDDLQDGQGVMKFSQDEFYEGEWKMGKQHGQGTYHNLSTGTSQSGLWSSGVLVS